MVYNNRALIAKTDEIALELDFPQTLAVVSRVPLAEAIDNADDDLKRETAFYAQAQAAVAEARKRLDGMNVPYLRPDDYYAEMLKSDNHMQRIRDSLLFEERKMAAFEVAVPKPNARTYHFTDLEQPPTSAGWVAAISALLH